MNSLKKLYLDYINYKESENNEVKNDYHRLGYHLMPKVGWLVK